MEVGKRQAKTLKFYESNVIGLRFNWLCDLLNLKLAQISRDTNIPANNLFNLSNGQRTVNYEDIDTLCKYLDGLYSDKFGQVGRSYQGTKVNKITFTWMLLGKDPTFYKHEKTKEMLEEDSKNRELDLLARIWDLEAELSQLKTLSK